LLFSKPNIYQNKLWAGRTIGLLGGSFNPAHSGHRHISLYALKYLGLDAIWWMVSPQNPLKSTKDMASLKNRMASARKTKNHNKIIITDIEKQLGTRYTADTLKNLKKHFPSTKFIWLMGTDNLRQINKWQKWENIFKMMPIAILDRPPHDDIIRSCKAKSRFKDSFIKQEKAKILKYTDTPAWTILHIPLNSISATSIREKNKVAR